MLVLHVLHLFFFFSRAADRLRLSRMAQSCVLRSTYVCTYRRVLQVLRSGTGIRAEPGDSDNFDQNC